MLQLGAINKDAGNGGILSTHGMARFGGNLTGWKDVAGRDWNGKYSIVLELGQGTSLARIQEEHRLTMIVRLRKGASKSYFSFST